MRIALTMTEWHHEVTQASDVYLKLTVIDDVLIVSFKEL